MAKTIKKFGKETDEQYLNRQYEAFVSVEAPTEYTIEGMVKIWDENIDLRERLVLAQKELNSQQILRRDYERLYLAKTREHESHVRDSEKIIALLEDQKKKIKKELWEKTRENLKLRKLLPDDIAQDLMEDEVDE